MTFGFNHSGVTKFQQMTSVIAHRGISLGGSASGDPLFQHFAVALDNVLVTVPSIDDHVYPDGVPGSGGAEITGGFTVQSAKNFASLLRDGELPLALTQISVSRAKARG